MSSIASRCARLAAVLIIAGASAGCAVIEASVELPYTPTADAQKIAAADGAPVALRVSDQRGFTGTRIGSKRNGYGMEMAAIYAAQPVDQTLKNAIAQELTARGFVMSETGAPALIEVRRFYADYKPGFFSAGLVGEVDMLVKVTAPDGKILFSDVISGGSHLEGLLVTGSDNVRDGAQLAMADAVRKLVTNQSFITALIPPPAPTPAAVPAPVKKKPVS